MTQVTQPVEAPSATTATQPVEAPGAITASQIVRPEVQPPGPASQTFPSASGRSVVQPDPTDQTVTAKKSRVLLCVTGTAHPEEQDSGYDNFTEHTSPIPHMEEEARSLTRSLSDQNQMRMFKMSGPGFHQ